MFQNLFGKTFQYAVVVMLSALLLSLGTYFLPTAFTVCFWIITIVYTYLAWKHFPVAILVMLGELMVGSQGHLFFVTMHGFLFPIRLAFFLILFVAAGVRLLREPSLFLTIPGWKYYLGLLGLLVLGCILGFLGHNSVSDIFFDSNGYLFLGLVLVVSPLLRRFIDSNQLVQLFAAGVVMLAVQTGLMLAIFSHQYAFVPELYRWARDIRLAEITFYAKNFYRIFLQSQIYSVYGLFLFLTLCVFGNPSQRERRKLLLLVSLASATILLSFSRSFWISVIVVFLGFTFFTLKRCQRKAQTFTKGIVYGFILLIAQLFVISFLANYPYLWNRPGGQSALSLFSDRTDTSTQEVAAASRFDQLLPLSKAILHEPILGSGFGTSVTYVSHDPRIVAATGGTRTTFAFEWGYLDMLLKIGLVGVAVLFLWLWHVLRALHNSWNRKGDQKILSLGMIFMVSALLVTHFSTPYLGHPLGIGLLVVLAGYATQQQSDRRQSS